MEKFIVGVIAIVVIFCAFSMFSCTTIEPGYVGIKVNQWGSQRGVEDFPIMAGRVMYNPITEKVYEYPTFLQSVVWDKAITNENPEDDSITFNSIEGSVINADIAISYAFIEKMVPHLFVEFRQDAKHIMHVYMRSQVRDAFGRHASVMKVTDIFGQKKQELLDTVKKDLNAILEKKGVHYDMISFVGALRVDPKVEASINAVIEASQKAIEAQNKIVQSKAEAEQQIEKARGESESTLLRAKAQAEANRLQAESLNSNLLQWNALQKWDGKLPQFSGSSAVPFLQLQQPAPSK